MNAWLVRCAAILLALSASGCALFGAAEEEPTELEQLPVVADDRAFDPSQAVDDDDDLEPWKKADAQDADAFAGTDSKVLNRAGGDGKETPASGAHDRSAAPASSARDTARTGKAKADEPKRGSKDAAPGARVPADEHVAGPREVEQKRAGRRERFDTIDRERSNDGKAKAEFAANPPPEEIGKAKSSAWTLLDYTLEGTLLLIGASGITALIALARRFPKTVTVAVAIGLAALALLVGSQSE